MNKRNYQKELDRIIEKNTREGVTPRLLLHVCCAPCSSYCLEYLSDYFDITVYYFNPNITSPDEYAYRLSEEERYISLRDFKNPVSMTESDYDPQTFFDAVKGLEREPEGGKRCGRCFRLRLEASARKAKELGFEKRKRATSGASCSQRSMISTVRTTAVVFFREKKKAEHKILCLAFFLWAKIIIFCSKIVT